jgi:glycerol-3-phosphate acyltransferase PlsY
MWMLLLAVAYLAGSIPTGLLLVRSSRGIDVRRTGSGNIGATNVLRAAGRTLGSLTLLGDVLKGALPTAAATWLAPTQAGLVGLAAFLGHLFPPWLGFKGGKGVSTALGVLLVLDPWSAGLGVAVFAGVLATTGYVSLGSMIACVAVAVRTWSADTSAWPLAAIIAGLVLVRHAGNVRRLARGEEPRTRSLFLGD